MTRRGRRPAGFRFTPSAESEWTLALDFPLHIVGGGGVSIAEKGLRHEVQPMDRRERPATWKVGGDAEELVTELRYQRYPAELMDALRASVDGLRLDYYPRLDASDWFFPVQVVGVGKEFTAREDSERHVHGEYRWRQLRLRHLATGGGNCGDSFDQLLTGNLLLGPRMYRDADGDGAADHWTDATGADTTPSIAQRGQQLELVAAGAAGLDHVEQIFRGALPGDVYELTGEVRLERDAGTPVATILARQEAAGGAEQANVDTQLLSSVSDWAPFSHTFAAAAAGTERLRLGPAIEAQAAGDDGRVGFRDLELRLLEETP